jgi:hypothetical protein
LPISYQTSISLRRNLWSRPAMVDFGKAITRTRPAATAIGPAGSGQVIVVWRDSAGRLLYSIGKAGKGNTLTWNGVTAIRGAASSNGPAVYTALHSNAVLLVWKAASGDAIDFVVGVPDFPTVKWGKIGEIPRAATTATPAIAEVSTGKGVGEIFVLWKAPGKTGPVDFALTTDPLRPFPRWTSPRSLSPKIRTGASPSAQAAGTGTLFPLLVVFQVARGPVLEYVTLAKNGAITGPLKVPHIGSVNGTAINPGVLAAEAPDPRKVFYEPFVRPCAGC